MGHYTQNGGHDEINMDEPDTIAAIATAPGRGGIGVVRVSGSLAPQIAKAILGGELPPPRLATFKDFVGTDGDILDQGIALFFQCPHSFTGEDVLELQGHGGTAVMQLLLERCLSLGARLAEPGEFSRRAFLNEKMDLAQAESVADLIDAASSEAAKSALRSLRGEFSAEINKLVDGLINLRMLVEATLDFPDEEIDFLEATQAFQRLENLRTQLSRIQDSARQGSLLREGMHVVLIGRPNVGKSSLLNRLAGEDIAIVTEIAGTTRDAIRQHVQIDGIPLHVIDTAGLRDTEDQVEKIGIERTWEIVRKADVALLLIDVRNGTTPDDQAILGRLPECIKVLHIYNKIDAIEQPPNVVKEKGTTKIYLSAKTGQGVDALKKELLEIVGWHASGEGVYMARERHLRALAQASEHLDNAGNNQSHLEFLAEELSLAQKALGSITGEFTSDDLLGEIFTRFCIGK
jgi:tRNA modification GTPase